MPVYFSTVRLEKPPIQSSMRSGTDASASVTFGNKPGMKRVPNVWMHLLLSPSHKEPQTNVPLLGISVIARSEHNTMARSPLPFHAERREILCGSSLQQQSQLDITLLSHLLTLNCQFLPHSEKTKTPSPTNLLASYKATSMSLNCCCSAL